MSVTVNGLVKHVGVEETTVELRGTELEYPDDIIVLPVDILPKNTKEGDCLRIVIAQDPQARKLEQRDDVEFGGFQKHLNNLSSRGS